MNNQWRWFFGIVLGLTLIIFITWQIVKNVKVEKYLQQTAETELNKLWPDRVHFSFDGIRFKFLQKEIDLKDVKFQIFSENRQDTLANLNLQKLTVKWHSYKNLIKRDTIKIQHIDFYQLATDFPTDFNKIKPRKQDDSGKSNPFKIQIGRINFTNSSLFFYDNRGAQKGEIKSKYNILVENIYYDSEIQPTLKNTNVTTIDVELNDLNYFLADGFHQLTADKISLQPLEGNGFISNLLFKPIYKWSKFAALKKERKDHMTLKTDSIWFVGFKTPDTLAFVGQEIGIKNPELYIHKDKNYPIPDDRFVPILVDKLEQTDFPIYIKKFIVDNMYLDYKELPEGGNKRGHLFFNNLNGEIENITNIKDSVQNLEEKTLKIAADAKFFGKGMLKADIRYALQSVNGDFTIEGSLTPMKLEETNELISPLAPMKIRKGTVDQLEFYFSGGRTSSKGEMVFKYSELKVDVITNEDKKFKDDILTLFANLVVPEFNPKPNGKLRIGQIYVAERDTRRSMFKFWVDNLVSGFKSTVGISDAAEIEENENDNSGKGFWGKLGFGKSK